ncbi:MAG: NADH-quinone oxidoreductase subunit L [Planctomycetota bacterium]|nr:NADH-quinone oxidoreductase subunit L [Planctomycetota bacterium]
MFELSSEVLSGLALCVPVLPLIAAVVSAVLGSTRPSLAPLVASVGVLGAFAASLLLLLATAGHGGAAHTFHYGTWFTIGHHSIDWEIRLDALATAMVCMVTFISFWIVIFSQGYMDGDPGSARFFSLVSLFVGAMAILVLANSLVVMFLGWEGVGVCSYLLVGFWFRKPEAAAAARKAFLVTRLGDVALLGALLLLACQPGSRALTFDAVFSAHLDAGIVYFVLLLLLIGAVGKSAQFPLHVWLPDAMEGPTPVSALIHAATMVTAGVYLLARFFPGMTGDSVDLSRLDAIASVQDLAGGLGAITALSAAIMAMGQSDLKRVLAYSTLSQLGYMFMVLGVSGEPRGEHLPQEVIGVAAFASIFHLLTHAFFKALLFLSAGSVMHAMGHIIDMNRFGGLRRLMPITHASFLVGALALAGFPPLSGFFSKDEILLELWNGSLTGGPRSAFFAILFSVGLITAGLTAYYIFRAYFKTFHGEEKIPHEAGHHAHESPRSMTVPLMVLAVCSVVVGLAVGPTGILHHYLSHTSHWHLHESAFSINIPMILGVLAAFTGVAVAWMLHKAAASTAKKRSMGFLETLADNRLYIDGLYLATLVRPLAALGSVVGWLDRELISPLIELGATVPRMVGGRFRSAQNGLLQFYALAMALGLIVILAMFTVAR